jgi:hypothetical protein
VIRQWLSDNGDPTYAIVAFFFFFMVFLGACGAMVLRGREGFRKQEGLPLED